MEQFVNITKGNEGTIKELIQIGLLKSYDLKGSVGRQVHDKRIADIRRTGGNFQSFQWEERNSRLVPYNLI